MPVPGNVAFPEQAFGASMSPSSVGAASNVLSRFRAALDGEDPFLAIVDAGRTLEVDRMQLADWACRTVTALALEAATASADAVAVREGPAVTLATATAWEQRLRELVDRFARDSEVAAYERGEYKALITILDVIDCPLVIATSAAASVVDLPAAEYAARLVRQLVGPPVVEFDYWRGMAMSVPAGINDTEVFEACDRAEDIYRRFFDTEQRVLASLAELLR
jgi:hypothetical protein